MSSPGQLLLTDRASIDRVFSSFTCVDGRPWPKRDCIAILDDENAVFASLEALGPLSWEVTVGVATRGPLLHGGVRLYVARDLGEIDHPPPEGLRDAWPLHTLWQLDEGTADRLLAAYSRLAEDAERSVGEERAFANRCAPWSSSSARTARGLAMFCYVSAN